MEIKHWFKVALLTQTDDPEHPHVCGVQRVYVDNDGKDFMVDLANVFVNIGVEKLSPQLKVFILKNSRTVAMSPMMVEPDKVAHILIEASATGLIPDVPLQKIQEFVLDLNNHVIPSARSAYFAANPDLFAEETSGGDDE